MTFKILSVFLLTAPVACAANPFTPVINPNGVVNAASYLTAAFSNYGLARGSLFLVFGSALGPQTLVSATYPLPTSDGLAGTRVLLSVGGYTAACPMVYTSSSQVAALVPSDAPEGDGTVVVAYQNLASTSVPVHLVHSAFGIFTVNLAGAGPAVLQNFVSQTSTPLNTLLTSAHPGQTVILWGTGLGPASGDETAGPVPGALPFLDNLYVGSQAASVRYAGRSGCCAGVDQIVFDIPAGVSGCYVPVAAVTGGVVSNMGTISIAAAGNECDDPLSFRATDLTLLERNGVLRTGQTTLSRTMAFGGSAGQLELDASFLSFDAPTLTAALGPLKPSLGSCYLSATKLNADLSGLPHGTGLDAGAFITANGPTGSITATDSSPGNYTMLGSLGNLLAGIYQFAGSGGTGVGAFQSNLNVVAGLQWTNASSFATGTVSTAQPVTVTWTGGDPNGYVTLQITSANSVYNASIQCNAPMAAGSFTVPAYLMGTVFQSTGAIALTSVSGRASISATGLDAGGITATDTIQVQANFQAPPR
jgi:uncharacterized protein (TIGR03437 family)